MGNERKAASEKPVDERPVSEAARAKAEAKSAKEAVQAREHKAPEPKTDAELVAQVAKVATVEKAAAETDGKSDDNLHAAALPALKGPAHEPVGAEAQAEMARAEQDKSQCKVQRTEALRPKTTKSAACPSTGILKNRLCAPSEIREGQRVRVFWTNTMPGRLEKFQYGSVVHVGGAALPRRRQSTLDCTFKVDYPPQEGDPEGSSQTHDLEKTYVEWATNEDWTLHIVKLGDDDDDEKGVVEIDDDDDKGGAVVIKEVVGSKTKHGRAGRRAKKSIKKKESMKEVKSAETKMPLSKEVVLSGEGVKPSGHRVLTLKPLTLAQLEKVAKALGDGDPNEVLAELENIPVRRQDMATLKPGQELNDEVINYFMKLLARREESKATPPSCAFMQTNFYSVLAEGLGGYNYNAVANWTRGNKRTKSTDVFSKDLIIIPIHGYHHWTLAVINMKQKRFEYFDSLRNEPEMVLNYLGRWLEDEALDKQQTNFDTSGWPEVVWKKECPRQKGVTDCGLFMTRIADWLACDAVLSFTMADMAFFRQLMVLEILNSSLVSLSDSEAAIKGVMEAASQADQRVKGCTDPKVCQGDNPASAHEARAWLFHAKYGYPPTDSEIHALEAKKQRVALVAPVAQVAQQVAQVAPVALVAQDAQVAPVAQDAPAAPVGPGAPGAPGARWFTQAELDEARAEPGYREALSRAASNPDLAQATLERWNSGASFMNPAKAYALLEDLGLLTRAPVVAETCALEPPTLGKGQSSAGTSPSMASMGRARESKQASVHQAAPSEVLVAKLPPSPRPPSPPRGVASLKRPMNSAKVQDTVQDIVQKLLGLLDVPRDLTASRSALLQGILKRGVEDTLGQGVKYLNTEAKKVKSSGEGAPAPAAPAPAASQAEAPATPHASPPAGSPGLLSVHPDVSEPTAPRAAPLSAEARMIKRLKVQDKPRVDAELLMSAQAKLNRFGSLADACLYVDGDGYLSLQELKELAIHAGVKNPAKASKTALVSALKEIGLEGLLR